MIELAAHLPSELLRWTKAALPHEACGLLFASRPGRIDRASLSVDATTTAASFSLPAHGLLTHAGDPSWVGLWHSHPEGPARLSAADARGARAWPRLVHLLVVPPSELILFACAADGLHHLPFSVASAQDSGRSAGAYVIESPPP